MAFLRIVRPFRAQLVVVFAAVSLAAMFVSPVSSAVDPPFSIEVLSSAPDQVSGGDALVRVQFPEAEIPEKATLLLNGADVTAALSPVPEGDALQGVVAGFALGENLLQLKPNPNATSVLAELVVQLLREELSGSWRGKLGYLIARPAFRRLRPRMDYSEYGAATLLGVKGSCFIGHGRSNAKAVRTSIVKAAELSAADLHQKIRERIADLHRYESEIFQAEEEEPIRVAESRD